MAIPVRVQELSAAEMLVSNKPNNIEPRSHSSHWVSKDTAAVFFHTLVIGACFITGLAIGTALRPRVSHPQ